MTTWIVRRVAGGDNNGGSSAAIRSTGTDGVTAGTNTLTAISAAWTAADVGHGIFIGGVNQWRLITAVGSATSLTFSGATIAIGAGRTWTIGGAWQTIAKLAANIQSGDTGYIGAGTYREIVTTIAATLTAETQINGDVDGAVTGDAGPVIMSAFNTDDVTAPASSILFSTGGKNYVTLQNIIFVGSSNTGTQCVAFAAGIHLRLRRCAFFGWGRTSASGGMVTWTATVNVDGDLIIEECLFWGHWGGDIILTLPMTAGAEYDCGAIIRNCLFDGPTVSQRIEITATGAVVNKGGGVDVEQCTFLGGATALRTTSANVASATFPCTISRCFCLGNNNSGAVNANAAGQITDGGYNIFHSIAHTNFTPAGTSWSNTVRAFGFHAGEELLVVGQALRVMGTPWSGSGLLGFVAAGGALTTDALNRPRPAGGSLTKAVGALERHETAAKETTTTDAGGVGLVIVGPGDHDIRVPVDASATVLSIKARYDTNHAATNKPQAILLANPAIGVTTETKTMTAAVDTWEQLTFAVQTPSAKGVVRIRLVSRAAASNGRAFFDTAGVA